MMTSKNNERLEHYVSVDVLPSSGLKLTLERNDQNAIALAETLEIKSVEALKADLLFKRWRRDGIIVKGRIYGQLTQECVASLEPVESEIVEEFERTFLPAGSKLAKPRLNSEGEMILDPEGDDIPDLFTGKALDAWEIVVEQIILALDPFPRAENVDLSDFANDLDEDADDQKQSPFAALKHLKVKK